MTMLSAITLISFAQGKSNGKAKHNKNVNQTTVLNNGQSGNEKYTKNLPAKVRESFNRDFPNAPNVVWTKDKGVWTASYNGGIFGNPQVVSYKANGQRM